MFYKNPYYDPTKSHHTKKGFQNPEPLEIPITRVAKWLKERWSTNAPPLPKGGYAKFIQDWMVEAHFPDHGDYVTWLGHCSLYFHLDNFGILTDPVFSERASFLNWIGPKRQTPRPINIQDIQTLQYVLISHEHYDHLDYATIMQLNQHFKNLTFIVPLGLERWFHKKGIQNVIPLDWWDSYTITDNLVITATPAQHWSNRDPFSRNRNLWCGYMISHKNRHHYFAGDTAYAKNLLEIGERFDIDYGYMPIGCYAPEWFMGYQHISPKDSVRLHSELKIKQSIGIHWGVFALGDEPFDETPIEVQSALKSYDTPPLFKVVPINTTLKLT